MLKFFRKTRYNLMETGKTTKYFKYAIGEIILVVIGILIALSINNWNTEREKVLEETVILQAIKEEFQENLKSLQISIERAARRKGYCLEILRFTTQENPTITKAKSDTLIFGGLTSHVTVELSDAYRQDLFSTGKIHYIQNKQLKKLLIKWEKYIEEIREDERLIFEEKSRLIKPFLLEHYSYAGDLEEQRYGFQSRFNKNYHRIYGIKQLEDLAIAKAIQLETIHDGYIELKKVIQEIIMLTEQ